MSILPHIIRSLCSILKYQIVLPLLGMGISTALLPPLLVVSVCSFLFGVKSKYVSVSVDAKWATSPLMLETSEFLAKESDDLFWAFANSIAEMDPQLYKTDQDEEMYRLSLKLAAKLLTPLQMNLLKFSLSLRAHSPRVEMFNRLAHDKRPEEKCKAFVDINNMISCRTETVAGFLGLADRNPKPVMIKSDHHFPGSMDRPVVAILYAELGTTYFNEWHGILHGLAKEGKIDYILRHYIQAPAETKVPLSGYGVELAIKSTEYKAKDDTKINGEGGESMTVEDEVEGFRFSRLREMYPNLSSNLVDFRQHLFDSLADLAPMKVWQLQDLSFQAAQKIKSSPPAKQLNTLRDVSQFFPTQAHSLAHIIVDKGLKKEVQNNQKVLENTFGISPGESAFFLNGIQADLEIYDVFTLLDTLKSEGRLMEGLHSLEKQFDLEAGQINQMLQIDMRDTDTNYAVDCRDDSILWINNLEKDRKYHTWPSSVHELLRPSFPGSLRHIRRNLFHIVFFINPVDKNCKDLLKMAEAFYVHNAPVRIGLVFVVNSDPDVDRLADAGITILLAFNYIKQKENVIKALSFVTDVYDKVKTDEISPEDVLVMFKSKYPKEDLNSIIIHVSDHDTRKLQEGGDFLVKTGLGDVPQVLINGVPLKKEDMDPNDFEEAVVGAILRQTSEIQKYVYHGNIYDGQDILEFLMTRSNVMPRLNSRVLSAGNKFLELTTEISGSVIESLEDFSRLSPPDMTSAIANSLHYISKKEEEILWPITNWLVADLETSEGRKFVYEAMKHLKHSNSVRYGIIYNPKHLSEGNNQKVAVLSQVSLEYLSSTMARSFITKLLKEENVDILSSGSKRLEELAVHNMDFEGYYISVKKRKTNFLKSHRIFCETVLNFKPGEMGIVSNGKVIGPLKQGEKFIQQDFTLLEKFMYKNSAERIEKKLMKFKLEPDRATDLLLRISTLLLSAPLREPRKDITFQEDSSSIIKLPASNDGPAYDVVAVLDPATRAAQKYSAIIMVLQQMANVNIKVFLNCKAKLSEMPITSFYQFVLEPEVKFTVDGELATGPIAKFDEMPEKPILTLGMDPPEGWLVEAVFAPNDLDNIHLAEVDPGIHAKFELEHLLLEGHCYDTSSGQPPRGLQFILGTDNWADKVDTIVMANLGYFQLKASPGAWNLKLRQGRSEEIYNIVSHDYTDSPEDSPDVIVVIDSFKSKIIKIRVDKKPGKEQEDLLSEKEEPQGLWDSISSKLSGHTDGEVEKDQTINIFSLASGHLYERFLRIMMLSVMKHTQSDVKFWFLKNFLSPAFIKFIPTMAEKYGFDYELVQYKWPRWLHQQTEKQRIIWGYKILFLDVLFPLNVNKIIFVDADQIVRTDLRELHDFDLEGAPYGYTPFCDSRKEMDGFRFWKTGYWASHLAGRKYHISALYVVDLKKFRKIAAGDRLRGQYQGLSQDPNSLSNLDQDLPNNMIHQVNIKSLPQEWLYCETWCSAEEKARAKTIDLCNNPLTKEPKLLAAVRIVPEWSTYDHEIKELWDEFHKDNLSAAQTDEEINKEKKIEGHIEL